MTLDEAIQHSLEKSNDKNICSECRKDHLQLYNWLLELKKYRENKLFDSHKINLYNNK